MFGVLGDEKSISDLKAISEVLMSGSQINKYHLALIRWKGYAKIGGKQFTFLNNKGAADLLEKVVHGELSKKRVLSEFVTVFESRDYESYFDHRRFSQRIRKHLERKR